MMKAAVLAALCLLAPAMVAAQPAQPVVAKLTNDVAIANFALNLECLEAEFYSWAAFGKGLDSTYSNRSDTWSVGGQKANLSCDAQAYAEEIAMDEINHVRLLRAALGSAAVPCPNVDIGPAFVAAANAAFNQTLPVPFNAYANDVLFYHAAFIFEDVGVTAYRGAAPLITDKTILSTAAGLLGTEAYHAGIIRLLLSDIAKQYVFPYAAPVFAIVDAISNLRDAADGPGDDDQGIVMGSGMNATSNLVPTDANGLVFARNPVQVLGITYLAQSGKGGFFPQGINL